MPELLLTNELQDYLVTQGIGQLPSAAPSGSVPSIWLDPRDGAPEPRDGENVAISIIDTGLAVPGDLDGWMDDSIIDIVVRSRSKPTAVMAHRAIRNLLAPINDYAGRKQWFAGALRVERSTIWRPEQPVRVTEDADRRCYTRTAAYRFEVRRKSLAGLPYAP